jgi:hypothetical protein
MNGVTLAARLPEAFVTRAAAHLAGRRELWDPPEPLPLEVARTAREFAQRQVAALERSVLPLLG